LCQWSDDCVATDNALPFTFLRLAFGQTEEGGPGVVRVLGS
jgi:hypothetical protein